MRYVEQGWMRDLHGFADDQKTKQDSRDSRRMTEGEISV